MLIVGFYPKFPALPSWRDRWSGCAGKQVRALGAVHRRKRAVTFPVRWFATEKWI